jgi:hypothetical protein
MVTPHAALKELAYVHSGVLGEKSNIKVVGTGLRDADGVSEQGPLLRESSSPRTPSYSRTAGRGWAVGDGPARGPR